MVAELTPIPIGDIIVMVDMAELVHPFRSVPVTIYEAFAIGLLTVTAVPVELLKPVEGDHEY